MQYSLKARSDRTAEFGPACQGSKLAAVVAGNSLTAVAGKVIEEVRRL